MICVQFVHLGVEALLKIHPPEDATHLSETELLPRLRGMKLRHTAQSEGYETMTQDSSDIVSEVNNLPNELRNGKYLLT